MYSVFHDSGIIPKVIVYSSNFTDHNIAAGVGAKLEEYIAQLSLFAHSAKAARWQGISRCCGQTFVHFLQFMQSPAACWAEWNL